MTSTIERTPAAPPGVHIHRSNRVERLADALCETLAAHPPGDPMRPVEIMVGSRGMERYLRLAIAERMGVSANIACRFLSPMLSRIERAFGLGPRSPEATQAALRWHPPQLTWAVLDALQTLGTSPDLTDLATALRASGVDPSGVVDQQRFALARTIADLFDRYTHERPDWFLGRPDPTWTESGWQIRLFTHLEQRLGRHHFPARLDALLTRLRAPRPASEDALPLDALHVFGVSRLAPAVVTLLGELGRHVPVHLYMLAATADYLGDLVTRGDAKAWARQVIEARLARDQVDASIRMAASTHDPLLVSFGRLSREMQILTLDRLGHATEEDDFVVPAADGEPPSILHQLQADLVENRTLQAGERRIARADDTSISVHACYGPARQVEALRDALLHLFARDPTLAPRDVVVMTPDVETYAPLVQAAFARGRDRRLTERGRPRQDALAWGPAGAPSIPVEIADLGLRRLNPMADALMRLLELTESRVTVTAVDQLLALEPVQRRFGFGEDDLDMARTWLREVGMRWAEDEADRDAAGQPFDRQNTFAFGLDRLALGVVMADDGATLWQDVLPVDAMEGEAARRFGRFAEALRTLFATRNSLRDPRPLDGWARALTEALSSITAASDEAVWLTSQVHQVLDTLREAGRVFDGPVAPAAIRALLDGQMENPTKGDRVVTGAVTLCALQPMRSVPFRVVCLLGLDDGAFPRRPQRPGYDLTARHPLPGDRDGRDEDRHLFLEALLSARDHFMVFHSGRDVRTSEEIPAAVPVTELLEAIDARFSWADSDAPPSTRILVHHPLQPFSVANFQPGAVDARLPLPWSFDRALLDVRRAMDAQRHPRPLLFDGASLPPPEGGTAEVALDDLSRFLLNPTRQLLRERLQLWLGEGADELQDREPIVLDDLERWSVCHDLLTARVAAIVQRGDAAQATRRVERRLRAQGRLPLGQAARDLLDEAQARVGVVVDEVAQALPDCRPLEISLVLGETTLRGHVAHLCGPQLLYLQSGQVDKPKHLVRAWVHLLAAQATVEDAVLEARLVGFGAGKADVVTLRAPGADPGQAAERARTLLAEMLDLRAQGLCEPLPLFEGSSHALASRLHKAGARWEEADADLRAAALDAAIAAWEPDGDAHRGPSDNDDPFIAAVWGKAAPFEGPEAPATARFVALAEWLWAPLCQARGVKETRRGKSAPRGAA